MREFCRVYQFAFAALPGLPQRVRSSISTKGSAGADAADGGVCAAVSMRGVWMEIFAAVVAAKL
jgi:hypothetical protein